MRLTCLARLLARHTAPATRMAPPSLAALLAPARVQVGQAISSPRVLLALRAWRAADLGYSLLLPERAGPVLCALANTEGHAASALCLTCTLERRWHGAAQPRRHARARGVARSTQPTPRVRRGGLRLAARHKQTPAGPPVRCAYPVPPRCCAAACRSAGVGGATGFMPLRRFLSAGGTRLPHAGSALVTLKTDPPPVFDKVMSSV